MKKSLLTLILAMLSLSPAYARKSTELPPQKVENLELLGRVWGFLKYHHPAVAAGKYDWDAELLRVLPNYGKLKNEKARDKFLVEWIESLGEVPVVQRVPTRQWDIKPDHSWMDTLSPELQKSVKNIYTNRIQGKKHYVMMAPNIGNPVFTNENPYKDTMPYPDAGYRLLSLFRLWNSVEYFFPEKRLTDKPWGEVLGEYIPVFLGAENELEYEIAALRAVGEICDSHAKLWFGKDKVDSLRGNNIAPFRVQFVEDKLVVTDYYNPEFKTLEIGDVISHIDGRSVEAIVDSLRPYYPASNEPARLHVISKDLLRSQKSEIDINGKPLKLYPIDNLDIYEDFRVLKDEKCYKILDGNIGYITLANINKEDIPEIKKSLTDTRGIIIDIRNYPSTYVPYALGSWFVSRPTPFVKFSQAVVSSPGEFGIMPPISIPPSDTHYTGKLVVLVNEISVSQSEFTAMAFRAGDNTTIIGSQTAGADGNVSAIFMPGGLMTSISGLGVYYPDGTQTQRIGIVPDIEVKPTIAGIREGRDELLNKAIETILL